MPESANLWQDVPSKYFCETSETNEFVVQGVRSRSRVSVSGLSFSFRVTAAVPLLATPEVGGSATSFAASAVAL